MLKIPVSEWRTDEAIVNAPTRGYNPHEEIPKILWKKYPELRDYVFGFCTSDKIPEWFGIGWRYLDTNWFPDVESFSAAIGTLLGVMADASGHIKEKENFIMVMPKKLRDRIDKKISEESESYYDDIVGSASNKLTTLPSETSMEESIVTPDSVTKAKRGRPRES